MTVNKRIDGGEPPSINGRTVARDRQQTASDGGALLLQGYEGMKRRAVKIPPQAKVRLTEALERLVQLYDGWGKPR